MAAKDKSNIFDSKLTWGVLLTAISFIGSYYMMYTKVDVMQESVKEIKSDVKETQKKINTTEGKITGIEVTQKHIQDIINRLDRRSASTNLNKFP